MLSIAEVSGIIAAAVMIVQYALPAALIIILVKYVGNQNSAVTWSIVNRAISTTLWPHLIHSDAVQTRQIPLRIRIPSWAATIGAALLVLASVLTPLGLRDEIDASGSKLVEFQYVKDPGPWGRVTMPRPDSSFTRYCEWGLIINCPGQYQGVYMNETSPGHYQSQETDENSTINVTIPANFTTMFTSATSNQGDTVSGLFDIQYRRWKFDLDGIINKGQPFAKGDSQYIGTLIARDEIVLTEGLIVDMRENPGIGFRNHTIPVGLEHGGTWTEDITWIEPITKCADSNLSIATRTENNLEFSDNTTFYVIDRGAFLGLETNALESRPWIDNQTLDLFGRAQKAARMHNVLVASSLNIPLPAEEIVPKIMMKDTNSAPPYMYSETRVNEILTGMLKGVGGAPPNITTYSTANGSIPSSYVNHYPDGYRKLLALNYSAITQVCRGYYEIETTDNDYRGNNITYPMVQCGFVLGAPVPTTNEDLSLSTYTGVDTYQKNLYVCASSVRASIKTVTFRYNGTGGQFSNLEVTGIADKIYPDEKSKPLWAAEHSYNKVMRFDPLWGMVDDRYETYGYKEGFYTLRAAKLWLPTSPFLTDNFGEREGYDALAAASGFVKRLGNLYGGGLGDLDAPDYSGRFDYTMLERFQRLSHNETVASQIPSLIMTDGLAAGLVGTKTSISKKYVSWPASLAVDDTAQGTPSASVTEYRRVIRYDIRYAIPAFIILALLFLALIWAGIILLTSRSILSTLKNTYNQTSTGRLATNLLHPGQGNPTEKSSAWARGDGKLKLRFGHVTTPGGGPFCEVAESSHEIKTSPQDSESAASPTLRSSPQQTSILVTPKNAQTQIR